MENNERINEVEMKESEIKEIDINLHKTCKSICKILYKIKQEQDFLLNYIKKKKNYYV